MAVKMIDYSFLIDAQATFNNIFEFEKVLKDFFDGRGLSSEVISPVEGSLTRRVIYLTKKPSPVIPEPARNPVGRPQTIKGKIKELTERKLRQPAIDFMKGK